MREGDRAFTGSIPSFYDLGPLLFADYAEELARRVAAQRPLRVLETAAGTGIVTRSLARLLPPVSVWHRIEENEISPIVTEAVAALFPHDPPQFLAPTPHGYHDFATIESELSTAGPGRIAIETAALRARALSPRDPALGFCYGSPLRAEIETRASDRLDAAVKAAAAALAARCGAGPLEGSMQAHIVTASA